MTQLNWFTCKNGSDMGSCQTKTKSVKVPLKLLCYNDSKTPTLDIHLEIESNQIKFILHKSESLDILIRNITKFQYSNENDVCRIYYKSSENIEPSKSTLFTNSIWFILNNIDNAKFESFKKAMSNFCNPTPLPLKLYINFRSHVLQLYNTEEYFHNGNATSHPLTNGDPSDSKQLTNNIKSTKETKEEPSSQDNQNTQLTLIGDLSNHESMQDVPSLNGLSISAESNNFISTSKTKRKKRPCEPLPSKRNGKKARLTVNRKFLYSPTSTQGIEISESDLLCLAPKEYLNDNIINMYLTYIFYEILTPQQRDATYLFNVFFNTKLIGTEDQQMVDTPMTRHARVAKWTKKIDIFSKDFIVIPVIEDQHWYLVIVCFPWMSGLIDYETLHNKKSTGAIPANNTDFAQIVRKKKREIIKKKQKIDPMPCILIFDSLKQSRQSTKLSIIREYLKSEWDARRLSTDGPLIFDKTTCRGYSPNIPKQDNGTDCGLFLLQYVESFFKTPLKSYSLEAVKSELRRWFSQEEINAKRQYIQSIILTKSKEISPNDDNNGDDDDDNIL